MLCQYSKLTCSLQVISCPQKTLMGPNRTKLLHDLYGQTHSRPKCGFARSIQLHSSHTQTYYEPTHVCMLGTCKHEPSETLETATKMFATKHSLAYLTLWLAPEYTKLFKTGTSFHNNKRRCVFFCYINFI